MTDTLSTAIAALAPRVYVATPEIYVSGDTVNVAGGASITDAIAVAIGNSAVRFVDVERNANYDEKVVVPGRTGLDSLRHIAVRAEGWTKDDEYQINPDLAASEELPAIRAADGEAAIVSYAANVRNISFNGFRVKPISSNPTATPLIWLVDAGSGTYSRSLSSIPSRIFLRHIWAGGVGAHNGTNNRRHIISGIPTSSAIIGSWFDKCNQVDFSYNDQAQAVSAINSAGPFRIYHTFFSASGEHLNIGGADSIEPCLAHKMIVQDLVYDRCYFYRNWSAKAYQACENGTELKFSRRTDYLRCVFDGAWPTTQAGSCFALTSNNNSYRDWEQTADVRMRDIWVRNYPMVWQFSKGGIQAPKPPPVRLQAYNVLCTGLGSINTQTDFDGPPSQYFPRLANVDRDVDDISVQRVTAVRADGGYCFAFSAGSNKRLNILDNVIGMNDYGPYSYILVGDHTEQAQWDVTNADASGQLKNTLFVGGNSLVAAPTGDGGCAHVNTLAEVGFVDASKIIGDTTEYADFDSCKITGTYASKGCDIDRLKTALADVCPDRAMLDTLYYEP